MCSHIPACLLACLLAIGGEPNSEHSTQKWSKIEEKKKIELTTKRSKSVSAKYELSIHYYLYQPITHPFVVCGVSNRQFDWASINWIKTVFFSFSLLLDIFLWFFSVSARAFASTAINANSKVKQKEITIWPQLQFFHRCGVFECFWQGHFFISNCINGAERSATVLS